MVVLHLPASAANIEVNAICTLIDAVNAANNDNDSGGLCPPGGSGADVLELTADVELTAVHNTTLGANGLPRVSTDIEIAGGGFEISRLTSAPAFRLFLVDGPNGELALSNVTVSGGVATGGIFADTGGAILADDSTTVQLTDATLEDNSADRGGAIYGSDATINVYSSTLSGNSVSQYGGGIGTYYGSVTVGNSTLSGNSADIGGAIWFGKNVVVALVNSTIASNTAARGGGISDYSSFFSAQIKSYGSVVGYNGGGDCSTYSASTSSGSFDSDGSCGFSGVLQGLDPKLADNGGPTHTHALLSSSTPIDAAGNCGLPLDQRGYARNDGLCDSGSFEFGAAPVGGSTFGHRVQQVTCRNVTTGQAVTVQQPQGAWDCEAAGLPVSSGDRIRQKVIGRPSDLDLGGTSIALGQLKASCENLTTGQDVRFVPSGTLTWSCLEQGLAYQPDDRVVQVFDGVVD